VGYSGEFLVYKVCGLQNQEFISLAPSGFNPDFAGDIPAKALFYNGVKVSKNNNAN
jgi:hypothetical protein